MPDSTAREIVMRQIAEAALAGDFEKVEEGVIVARALGASPQSNLDSKPESPEPPPQAPPRFDGNQQSRGRAESPKGVSKRKEARDQGKLARESFFSKLSSDGIRVAHTRNREYKTSKGKRFAVPFANEDPRGDLWWTGADDEKYDVIAFLCRTGDGKILDFVVPWSHIASRWTNFSRSRGQVEFHVRRDASGYTLDVPHGIGLPITSFLSNLAPLRG